MGNVKIVIGDSREMTAVADEAISLVVTSPPYWNIKDYRTEKQIGHGQTLHEYLKDLYLVWQECWRILKPGRRLCINIGDQFARSSIYGRYKIIPLHAEFISQCEIIGFDYMGSIIWQKKTTMNTTGGANIMGSYPFPPNGLVELDYEYILIFKKPGASEKIPIEIKQKSALTKEEWKQYFSGHWHFGGAKQIGHEAMFPEELPKRLIKMFSFVGETVLDPFLGSGTTVKVASDLGRNSVGYEINEEFLPIIQDKIGLPLAIFSASQSDIAHSAPKCNTSPASLSPAKSCGGKNSLDFPANIEIIKRKKKTRSHKDYGLNAESGKIEYVPRIQDAEPLAEPTKSKTEKPELFKVTEIVDALTLKLDSERTNQKTCHSEQQDKTKQETCHSERSEESILTVQLLGLKIVDKKAALEYLRKFVLKKQVFLRFDKNHPTNNKKCSTYVYLKNKIFINAHMIKAGFATADKTIEHKHKNKFINLTVK